MGHKFDIDKHTLNQELRDRIRAVIRGLVPQCKGIQHRESLETILAHLRPSDLGTNIERLGIGVHFHWNCKIHSAQATKESCALALFRQLIINFWDYLLEGSDGSLQSDGQIENHLETLEDYVERGLGNYVVVGTDREGFWLMWKGSYQRVLEDVR